MSLVADKKFDQLFSNAHDWVALKRAVLCQVAAECLSTFTSNATSKLNVLGHDGHTFGVDCTQIGVFEKSNQVSFARFLQRHDGTALESQVGLEILSDFANKSLKRQFANEELGRLLVSSDLAESNSSGSVAMRLLDASGSGSTLSCSLGSKLLSRSLASG